MSRMLCSCVLIYVKDVVSSCIYIYQGCCVVVYIYMSRMLCSRVLIYIKDVV